MIGAILRKEALSILRDGRLLLLAAQLHSGSSAARSTAISPRREQMV